MEGLLATYTLVLAILENAKKLDLYSGGQRGHFVQEEGSLFRKLESSCFARGCSCKGALFVTKEFGLNQAFWNGPTMTVIRFGESGVRVDGFCVQAILFQYRNRRRAECSHPMGRPGRLLRAGGAWGRMCQRCFVVLEFGLQGFVFLQEMLFFECLPDRRDDFISFERFGHIVVGAYFHGINGRFDSAVGGHKDDFDFRAYCSNGLEQLQAV